jgi:hypothetical protein
MDPLHSSAELPGSIGRGTGYTLKEIRRQLTAFMRRKGMPSHLWRSMTVHPERTLPRADQALSRPCRIVKDDLWAKL